MSIIGKFKKKAGNFKETYRRTKYARYYKHSDIEENVILYDSYFGRGMICNPYALFCEIMSDNSFKDFTHIWVMEDRVGNEPAIQQFLSKSNVFIVRRHSEDHLRHLASAKYIITNVSLPFYYCKKPGQIYINTWHGTPIKSLGYDIPGASASISNIMRNFLSADYLISANPFLTQVYLEKYKLSGIFNGKIIEEGYPRNDRLFHAKRDDVFDKLERFGIDIEKKKKIILYAPTWKGDDYYHPQINVDEYINFKRTLEASIDTEEYQVLLKPHQVVYNTLKKSGRLNSSLIPAYIDTNELLSVTDILVSDYSSIFFDFLATGRPVLFYIPDLEEYKNYRGLYMTPDKLPGPAFTTLDELGPAINNIDAIREEYSSVYHSARDFACPYDDGNVSKRLIDIIFNNSQCDADDRPYNIYSEASKNLSVSQNTEANTGKKKLLFFGGGLRMNGISTALRTMLDYIDYNKYDVTVFAANLKFEDAKEMIGTLNPKARAFSRIAYTPATFTEQFRNNLLRVFGFNFPFMKHIYPRKMYDREFMRCFGEAHFDTVIDYSGYGSFYSILLLSATNAQKLIWQHNDLKTDKVKVIGHKRPHNRELRVVFSAYPFYDKIVGCSEATMQVNLEKIGYHQLTDKCCYVRNAANFDRVIDGAMESFTPDSAKEAGLLDLLDPTLISFVNMGRLSPEKNQAALIKAFAKLYEKHKNTRLYIIGDGVLMNELKQLISTLGLDGKVVLTGNMENPFMLMKECKCFVLPSLHEGQPVSILEARLLELPIIMSNFSSAKSSLMENGQLVIGNGVEDIYQGLEAFLAGKVPCCPFYYKDYNAETIAQFDAIVAGK